LHAAWKARAAAARVDDEGAAAGNIQGRGTHMFKIPFFCITFSIAKLRIYKVSFSHRLQKGTDIL
jgi:hypothetical protein